MFCQCDKCGNRIRIDGATLGKPPASRHWRQVGKPFETSLDAPWLDNQPSGIQADFDEYERRQPTRSPTFEADVLVPGGKALLWGFVSLPFTIAGTIMTGWPWWAAPAMTGFAVSIGLAMEMSWGRQLLWLVEVIVKRDVDGDGQTGRPEPPNININHPGVYGFSGQRGPLPVSEPVFNGFVRGILAGQPITEARWSGLNKPFTRETFGDTCQYLFNSGILAWKDEANHKLGRYITPGGRHSLESYISVSPTPPAE